MTRILVTGSRDWRDDLRLMGALRTAWTQFPGAVLVHGDAVGVDRKAAAFWIGLGGNTERHPAREHPSPRARNQHMVDLGADACLAFASRWASGTGMCARMARRAGIPVFDFGVNTSFEGRTNGEQAVR